MVKALFDTNILIDYLQSNRSAKAEFDRYSERAISVVTWMEVMVGAKGDLQAPTRAFLNAFRRIPIDDDVAERAVDLRRQHKMKLPDAIIWASAQEHAMLLVTRNTRDYPADDPGIRIPY
jgi:hypothetical protein